MDNDLTRRMLLKGGALSLATLILPLPGVADRATKPTKSLTIGLITDLHHGNLVPDADQRLDVFLQAVADRGGVDMLVQLGDFCHPKKNARDLCKRFNAFKSPKLHVLGNHDMDLGTKDQIMAYWEMPARYNSRDVGGYHFVTLDRNHIKHENKFVPYANANFYVDRAKRAWADDEQLEWLEDDLSKTDLPTIVLTHQPIGVGRNGDHEADARSAQITRILEKANKAAGWTKVQACLCGHRHTDQASTHAGIHYLHFNSASYKWVREPVRYKDTLFAFVTLDPQGLLTVEGRATVWSEPTPEQRRLKGNYPDPAISSRELKTVS